MRGYEDKPTVREKWSLGKMARFLHMKADALMEKVQQGIVPCETTTRITSIENGVEHTVTTYTFDVERTLKCLDYKPRTRTNVVKTHEPCVYGYARASHRSNSDTDSVPAQIDRCTHHAKNNSSLSVLKFAGVMQDLRTSAYKIPFFKREGGRKLAGLLRRGDHLVVDKVDRLWRNVKDFINVMEIFKREGVTVHFVDQGGHQLDMSNPMDEMFLTFMVMGAQMESRIKSQRNKDSYQRLVAQGLAFTGTGFGMRISKYNGTKRFVWVPYERYISDLIVQWHDADHLSFSTIGKMVTDQIRRDASTHSGWTLQKRKMPFCRDVCLSIYVREKNTRLAGIVNAHEYSRRQLIENGKWKKYRELRDILTTFVPGNLDFSQFRQGEQDHARRNESPQALRETEGPGQVG